MYLVKYVELALIINTVQCIKEVELNNMSLKTVSALINILSKHKNGVKYFKLQPNSFKGSHANKIDNISHDKNVMGGVNDLTTFKKFVKLETFPKKTFIKRLIPHGLPPSKLEFDEKYKTIYMPLVRIHKRKPLPKIHTILNLKEDTVLDKYGIDIHDYYDNDEDVVNFLTKVERHNNLKQFNSEMVKNKRISEALLEPFRVNVPGNEMNKGVYTQLRMLQEIKRLLKSTHSRSVRMKTYDKIMKVLDRIDNLRTYEKSGEDNDPLAPGKQIHRPGEDEESTSRPKVRLPHYPPWNYWTYQKTIHQDECPNQTVKINDRCIWLPPH